MTTLSQARVHNKVNEIDTNDVDNDAPGASITATVGANWVDPTYDKAGNITLMPRPASPTTSFRLSYDAWNRLTVVRDAAFNAVALCEYDGLGRRIRRIDIAPNPDIIYNYYYNEEWQLLEERKNGDTDPLAQYVWHPYYIDALAIRYYDDNLDGTSVEHYYLQDANFNVTAITDNTGSVVERYSYSPYGEVTVLDENFAVDSNGTDIDNTHYYTGRERDPETGLQLNRNRFYAPHLGRWVTRDPIGYEGSAGNLYQYLIGRPLAAADPSGLGWIDWIPIASTIKHCFGTPKGSDPNDYDCESCQQSARDWREAPEAARKKCEDCIGAQGAKFISGWTGISAGIDGIRAIGGVAAGGAAKAAGRGVLGACTGGVLLVDAAADFACVVDGAYDIKDAAEQAKQNCCQPPK